MPDARLVNKRSIKRLTTTDLLIPRPKSYDSRFQDRRKIAQVRLKFRIGVAQDKPQDVISETGRAISRGALLGRLIGVRESRGQKRVWNARHIENVASVIRGTCDEKVLHNMTQAERGRGPRRSGHVPLILAKRGRQYKLTEKLATDVA